MQKLKASLLVCCLVLSALTLLHAQSSPSLLSSSPGRILGQASVTSVQNSINPNWADAKGLHTPLGIALDTTTSSPALYVADTVNSRVLGWQSAASFVNGAPADIVVGQRDMATTNAQGPNSTGSQLSRGLAYPTGVAVDSQGNLYVVDAGNNRILRYPKPFQLPDQRTVADLVIGQAGFDTGKVNRNGGAPSAESVSTSAALIQQSIVFDSNGNLWFADVGNNRVLRYPKTNDGTKIQGTADLVLGQTNLTSNVTETSALDKTGLRAPQGIAFDPSGRIYVSDALSRVLVYTPNPQPAGTSAVRLLGIQYVTSGSAATLNGINVSGATNLVMIGSNLGVVDRSYNRISIFAPFDSWPAEVPNVSSPAAIKAIGQADLTTVTAGSSSSRLSGPAAAVYFGTDLYVAEAGNHRVSVFPQPLTTGVITLASRELGQVDFGYSSANFAEGKEFFLFERATLSSGYDMPYGAVAVDTTSNPPRLYIADTFNNRVLAFKDARTVKAGDTADLIIGQKDRFATGSNDNTGDVTHVTNAGLSRPSALAVDSNGNLYVADTYNSRVLRFPKPFDQPTSTQPYATLVLGQQDFNTRNSDPSARTMGTPAGIAIMPEGHVLVSDYSHQRVLLFRKPTGADFVNGQSASAAFGQASLDVVQTGSDARRLRNPHGIATDSNGRLYVADTGNNRVLVYSQVAATGPTDDPSPVYSITTSVTTSTALRTPTGVTVGPAGEIWVADAGSFSSNWRLIRYPEFSTLMLTGIADFSVTPAYPPLSVALSASGYPIITEYSNRVSMYYTPAWVTNGANFLPRYDQPSTLIHPCCAPGSIASIWPFNPTNSFGAIAAVSFDSLPNPIPMPKSLGDIEVVLSSPDYSATAPLYYVSPGQINFQVPKDAPRSGVLNVTVQHTSTGEIVAFGSGTMLMGKASPAFLTKPGFQVTPTTQYPYPVQVAAQNYDDMAAGHASCNGLTAAAMDGCPGGVRPVKRGEILIIYATGQGAVEGMSEDGALGNNQTTTEKPRVYISAGEVPSANVEWSGVPAMIGVWQLNVKIPSTAAPGMQPIGIQYQDQTSSVGQAITATSGLKLPVIYVE